MAKASLAHPFDEIHGALGRTEKIINRQKKFRDNRGRVIQEGRQEAYVVKHPRDFKKTPPQGAEQKNQSLWTEACRRAAQIIQAARPDGPSAVQLAMRQFNSVPDYYSEEEALALYSNYQERYLAQLPNTRNTHPDSMAPVNPATGLAKRYIQFPSFLRTILYLELKHASADI